MACGNKKKKKTLAPTEHLSGCTEREKHCHAFVPETLKMGLAPEADAAGGNGLDAII